MSLEKDVEKDLEKGMEKTKHGKECGKGLGKGHGKGLKHREKWKRTGNVCERKHCSTAVLQYCCSAAAL